MLEWCWWMLGVVFSQARLAQASARNATAGRLIEEG
jgi:hypothetical protein